MLLQGKEMEERDREIIVWRYDEMYKGRERRYG